MRRSLSGPTHTRPPWVCHTLRRLLPAAVAAAAGITGSPVAAGGVGAAIGTPAVAARVIARTPAAVARVAARAPAATRVLRLAAEVVRVPAGSAGLALVDDLRLGVVAVG